MPLKNGIQGCLGGRRWIPAFAGMTDKAVTLFSEITFLATPSRPCHAVEERHPGMFGVGEDGFRLSPE